MSPSKLVSTLVHLINFGVSSDNYYSSYGFPASNRLRGAKAFWDDEKRLCFEIEGKVFKLALVETAHKT
jgi:hypothetical protein